MHEEDKDSRRRKKEEKRCRKLYNTNLSFSHTLSAHIPSLSSTLIYIHTLSFSEKLPLPISFITSPRLAQARILIDFICAHVSETVAKTREWMGEGVRENEKLEYIEEGKKKKGEKAKMQSKERTNTFSLFCAYVIKTAIYMYLCFRRVWSLFLPLHPHTPYSYSYSSRFF